MFDFEKAIEFTRLLERFQKVRRVAYVSGEDRMENDVEHSYKLAMMAWYLVEREQLPLDTSLVVKYAMVHDLVEAYAGDTDAWDAEGQKTKHEREEKARLQLIAEFNEFSELHGLIERYENKADEEARFVYALDKLFYMFTEYLAEGRTMRKQALEYGMEFKLKEEKTRVHDRVHAWCLDVFKRLDQERDRLWGK